MEKQIINIIRSFLYRDQLPDEIKEIEKKKHLKGKFNVLNFEARNLNKSLWWYTLKEGSTIRARGVVCV